MPNIMLDFLDNLDSLFVPSLQILISGQRTTHCRHPCAHGL
jgi:hypothetical protein